MPRSRIQHTAYSNHYTIPRSAFLSSQLELVNCCVNPIPGKRLGKTIINPCVLRAILLHRAHSPGNTSEILLYNGGWFLMDRYILICVRLTRRVQGNPPEYYRPILFTCICEDIITSSVMRHLDKHALLADK